MKVLVTGAAGYIGSHVARALEGAGHSVVRLDDLSTGWEGNVAGHELVRADVLDRAEVERALVGCDAVAHLAGAALVPESVALPEKYWRINLAGGLALVEAMLARGVRNLVFSSTCAVYGIPREVPIPEDAPHAPLTPYGASKAAFERLLSDVGAAHGLRAVVFRYFNAAGCDEAGDIGELHEPETHVIPNVLRAIRGLQREFTLHGTDYPTADGTCVRDYVDVRDIARAHVLALEALDARTLSGGAYNLGWGRGTSVREIVAACERVTGRAAPVALGPRRPGDPPELVAGVVGAPRDLGWRPVHDLDAMVATAWRFLSAR